MTQAGSSADRLPPLVCGDDGIAALIRTLRGGGVAVLPTDTVYGLSASLAYPQAIERIFAIKGRDAGKQLPVLVADVPDARRLAAVWSPVAEALAQAYWPGALTIVVEASSEVPEGITRGGSTVGLRCADHAVIHAALVGNGGALAVTSANRSGDPPARTAQEALAALSSDVDLIYDDGLSRDTQASTVVRVRADGGLDLLREGSLTLADLERVVGVGRIDRP